MRRKCFQHRESAPNSRQRSDEQEAQSRSNKYMCEASKASDRRRALTAGGELYVHLMNREFILKCDPGIFRRVQANKCKVNVKLSACPPIDFA